MAAELVLSPEAERDITASYDSYEQRRAGLGEELLGCVDACIQAVCRMLEMYAKVHEDYRRALVRRFPYAIFYEYAAGKVTVYSVFHTARDPDKWRDRLM